MAKRPARGTSSYLWSGLGSSARGIPKAGGGVSLQLLMSMIAAGRFFAAPRSSRGLVGVAVVAVALAGSLALLAHGGITPSQPGSRELDLIGVVLAACSTVPLLAWGRAPLGVFVVTAAASVLLAGLGYAMDLMLGPTAALYLLTVSRDQQKPWRQSTTAAVVGLLVAYLGATAASQQTWPGIELLHTGLAWTVAWFAGERTRRQTAELRERARRAEREAERERLLAVAEERARIARDLHDSAGHAISVIAVRAGAARLRHRQDPDRSLAALEAVEELARQTVDEIDQIVGSLRDSSSSNGVVEAPSELASLDTLIAQHASVGLEVTVDTDGAPRPLGGAVDQAAYRILQEALTNAARHGAGSARIELAYDDAAVELTITNPVLVDSGARSGGGHGLIGMRERALLLGGNLEAERTNGTFWVRARLPYEGSRV
jgi:signal transduction histidine kinase